MPYIISLKFFYFSWLIGTPNLTWSELFTLVLIHDCVMCIHLLSSWNNKDVVTVTCRNYAVYHMYLVHLSVPRPWSRTTSLMTPSGSPTGSCLPSFPFWNSLPTSSSPGFPSTGLPSACFCSGAWPRSRRTVLRSFTKGEQHPDRRTIFLLLKVFALFSTFKAWTWVLCKIHILIYKRTIQVVEICNFIIFTKLISGLKMALYDGMGLIRQHS